VQYCRERTNQIVQLSCRDTTIDTRDDLLGDGNRVYVVHIQTITESGDPGCDLVELDTFLTSICDYISHVTSLYEIGHTRTSLADKHGCDMCVDRIETRRSAECLTLKKFFRAENSWYSTS
jgi:hypothetical protein